MRRALAGDDEGYYRDYSGRASDVALTLQRGWFYEGERSVHWNRARGTSARDPAV